jgi:hypothetical protein
MTTLKKHPPRRAPMGVRIRGIYATALTELLDAAVVQASPTIRDRFPGEALETGPATVAVTSSRDRIGVSVSGAPEPVERVGQRLTEVSRDTFAWPADAPVGAVYSGRVTETVGGGAIVDLGPTSGYLPFDAAEGYVETGDAIRVQVARSVPPWVDRRPRLRSELRVERPLGRLLREESGVRGPGEGEVAGLTDLLDRSVPAGWGLRWSRGSEDATMETLDAVLEDLVAAASALDASLADATPEPPARLHGERETTWIRFGREGRFALDATRRAVTTTMAGHHRIKAGGGDASTAVDFAEALERGSGDGHDDGSGGESDDADLNFGAVSATFGPQEGDTIRIRHGKPDGRAIDLGEATVTDVDPGGGVTIEREIRSRGTYDGLETTREPGDVATTSIKEGRWWYPTVYRGPEGASKGTYVNVCTPVECFPDRISYVDLHVDVVQRPDGTLERLDEEELDAATAAGHLSEALATKARSVAAAVESGLAGE